MVATGLNGPDVTVDFLLDFENIGPKALRIQALEIQQVGINFDISQPVVGRSVQAELWTRSGTTGGSRTTTD